MGQIQSLIDKTKDNLTQNIKKITNEDKIRYLIDRIKVLEEELDLVKKNLKAQRLWCADGSECDLPEGVTWEQYISGQTTEAPETVEAPEIIEGFNEDKDQEQNQPQQKKKSLENEISELKQELWHLQF